MPIVNRFYIPTEPILSSANPKMSSLWASDTSDILIAAYWCLLSLWFLQSPTYDMDRVIFVWPLVAVVPRSLDQSVRRDIVAPRHRQCLVEASSSPPRRLWGLLDIYSGRIVWVGHFWFDRMADRAHTAAAERRRAYEFPSKGAESPIFEIEVVCSLVSWVTIIQSLIFRSCYQTSRLGIWGSSILQYSPKQRRSFRTYSLYWVIPFCFLLSKWIPNRLYYILYFFAESERQ